MEKLKKLAIEIPEIYLPAENVDYSKFSVIACDQYTSRPQYWEQVEKKVGDSPSSLNMMLPEIYLDRNNDETRAKINATMQEYIDNGTLVNIGKCFVYVKRHLESGVRQGLVLALDLEQYDFHSGSDSMIRATEKTVESRLHARIEIRRNAPLEMPHILVLINDAKDKLFSYISSLSLPSLYDFELMQNGGRIEGYKIDNEEIYSAIADILEEIKAEGGDNFLYAMGDGNHSLASAKAFWDEIKESVDDKENHPARYALVEIENIFDEAMIFEPIHRVIFGTDKETLEKEVDLTGDAQDIEPRLDKWLAAHPEASIDYIHGKEEAIEIAEKNGGVAIVFDEFEKASLFDTVRKNGCLVRKSFSMGAADTKRFYLECRKI